MAIKEYAGGAAATTLASGISNSDVACTCADLTNYPTGATGNFWIVVDESTSKEEKIKCATRSGNSINFASGGRGGDGTTAFSHDPGAVVRHVFVAEDARDANNHIFDLTRDDHGQYLNVVRHDVTGRHTPGTVVPAGSSTASLGNNFAGSAGAFSLADHAHGFPPLATFTTTWLAGGSPTSIGNGTLISKYAIIGKRLWLYISLVWGSTTSASGGNFTFTLPTGAVATNNSFFPGICTYGASFKQQPAILTSNGGLRALDWTFQGYNDMSSGAPFNLASGHSIQINGNIEIN